MVNSKDLEDDDFVDEDANKVEEVKEVVPVPDKCPACGGTGAVPENIVKGKVDTYKDCTVCAGKGLKIESEDPNRCKECSGTGKVITSFVGVVPATYDTCPTCKGNGTNVTNE